MFSIVWSIEKKRDSNNSRIVKTKNGKIMVLSNCAVYSSKKSRF